MAAGSPEKLSENVEHYRRELDLNLVVSGALQPKNLLNLAKRTVEALEKKKCTVRGSALVSHRKQFSWNYFPITDTEFRIFRSY